MAQSPGFLGAVRTIHSYWPTRRRSMICREQTRQARPPKRAPDRQKKIVGTALLLWEEA